MNPRTHLFKQYDAIFNKAAAPDDDDSDDDRRNGDGNDDDDIDDEAYAAAHYLLHNSHGAALVRRVFPRGPNGTADVERLARLVARGMAQSRKRATRKDSSMNRTDQLYAIVKAAGGLGPLCQKIVKRGSADVTEAELTGMITHIAKAEYPDLDDARAFTKLFAGPNGELLRRAVMVAKAAPLPEPEVAGGGDATDVDDPAKALAHLQEMIAELRRRAHDLSESEAWNRVVRDHPALAKRAIAG